MGGSIGPVHLMHVWRSTVEDHWISAIEGRLESHGGRNGSVNWSEDWGSAVERALVKCSGWSTGVVQQLEH